MEPTFKKAPPGSFDTPFNKLLPLSTDKQNICLVLSGSFFPIHNNHLRTLEKVKEQLSSSPEYHVIGGYIMPTHNSNLQKKLGNYFLPPVKRLEMYQLATADSDWIDVDPYLLMQPKNIGMEQARARFEQVLNEKFTTQDEDGNVSKPNKPIKAISVMGVDNIPLVEKRIAKDLFIFVQNRPSMSQFEAVQWLESDKVKPFQHNVILIKDEDIPYEMSATVLRDMICKGESVEQYIPAKVCEFFKVDSTFQKVFKSMQQKAKDKVVEAGGPVYAEPLESFGLSEDSVKENLKEHVDFPFHQIEFDELIPERTFGQPTKLGRGLAAVVWAMKWNDIPVAVKIFNISAQKSRKIGSFKLELRALHRINSKYVVKCLGAGSVGNGIFIVMERAETLNIWNFVTENADMWHKKGYSLAWIDAWANLAEGCHAMSTAGVFHRDLQLDNILLFKEKYETGEEENKAQESEKIIFKLSDFGVSSLEEDRDKVIRGSIRHYAPEAIEDKMNYTSACDVYSFGMLLHEMIHGKRIYSLNPTSEMTVKVIAGERPEFEVPCHQKIKNIIEACWTQKPSERPNFDEVAQMLRNTYNELSG